MRRPAFIRIFLPENKIQGGNTMNANKIVRSIKPYEELEFRDDFMFGKVMQDKELCHDVLECMLQEPVGNLQEIETQKEFRYIYDGKPIRMDVYTKDNESVFDAEMQNLNKKTLKSLELPRRTRFYQSSIDTDHLNRGNSYDTLPDSKILFICTFDPFQRGLYKYTFNLKCEEEDSIRLDDGTTRIFFNCRYTGKDIPEEMIDLYSYIVTGTVGNDLTRKIHNGVLNARKREDWRSAYMKEMVLLMDAKQEGREEGREDTIIGNIRELMKNMKWTAEQAMKALGLSEEDQAKYSSML